MPIVIFKLHLAVEAFEKNESTFLEWVTPKEVSFRISYTNYNYEIG